ncbi:MAG: hypothetical protein LQ340_003551, partial [Diploschistes diacapsis]
MGHLRVYTIADVLARFRRMQGCRLLYPMGWDAFGLPAENAAIERGLHPAVWTKANIAKMKDQLKAMNGDIDWSRVDANGFSWRSGAKVEKLNLKQWFLRITAFKEVLLDDLGLLQNWPERVTAMQRNWIGRAKGGKIKFEIVDESGESASAQHVSVFTTRPDTLFGVQYVCLSAKHPLVVRYSETDRALSVFLDSLASLPADSKLGYKLERVYAKNPLSYLEHAPAFVEEPVPVYVSPYVLEGYGEGAVMGVPAHDSRDWEFWTQNGKGHPVRRVILPENETTSITPSELDPAFTGKGILEASCGNYAGMNSKDAARDIISDLAKVGNLAEARETWRLRDWLISRQRYWGTPIPIIHCGNCGAVPVPIDQLPVELPNIDGSSFRHRAGNPLDNAYDWVNTSCPKCSGPARRDTDTMDTFMDSSWYMFRFVDPRNKDEPFSPNQAELNMPVDIYLGGIEHAILHLLYARFIGKFLATTPLWPSGASPEIRGEPFKQQISQGMVHGMTFSDPDTGRFLRHDELDLTNPAHPKILSSGQAPNISFEKMSKSKHNGVDPSSFIAKYGADVTRAHMLFQAPIADVLEWEEERIAGVQRWLARLLRLTQNVAATLAKHVPAERTPEQPFPFPAPAANRLSKSEGALYLACQRTIASVTTSLEKTHALNT